VDPEQKRFVYLLQSSDFPERLYVGITSNVSRRLEAHNAGRSPHTAKYRPWKIIASIEFATEEKAIKFEKYAGGKSTVRRTAVRTECLAKRSSHQTAVLATKNLGEH
jgi:putative endonuclease